MPVNVATLRTELASDPRGYGYAPLVAVANDPALTDMLNAVRDGTNPPANPTAAGGAANGSITVKRIDCNPAEILEAIDVRDLATAGLPAGMSVPLAQSWLESVTQFARIRLANDDGTKTLTRRNIDRLVASTNGSQARLDAVAVRLGSRAEELFGAGVVVTRDDVGSAR
jgi:hypothetical protein